MSLFSRDRKPVTAVNTVDYAIQTFKANIKCVNPVLGRMQNYILQSTQEKSPHVSSEIDHYFCHILPYFPSLNILFERPPLESPHVQYICATPEEAQRVCQSLKLPSDCKDTHLLLGQELALIFPNSKFLPKEDQH